MKCCKIIITTKKKVLFFELILIFCVTWLVYIYLLYRNNNNLEPIVIQANVDFDHSLCEKKINNKKFVMKTQFHSCPQNNIVTMAQGGRLANQMWEYASVLAFAREHELEPYVPRCVRNELETVFEAHALTVPALDEIAHCPIDFSTFVQCPEFVDPRDILNDTSENIIFARWVLLPDLVLTWFQDVNKEFIFKQEIMKKADSILRAANKQHHKFPVYVGVHVRRTDYSEFLKRKYHLKIIDAKYFYNAMDYFEGKYKSVVFVVVSDDPDWCKKYLTKKPNVYIVGKKTSPAQDLAVLSTCNHSIIDYGTYGLWGAIQAGGETIVYNITKQPTNKVAKILPNWQIFS